MKKIILASNSKRREELMRLLGLDFIIKPASYEKKVNANNDLTKEVETVALLKAQDVFKDHKDALVIGSDTIVVINDEVLGKPKDKEDAIRMLKLLSGKTHKVITAVAFVTCDKVNTFYEETFVEFDKLQDEEIYKYVESDEPYDKAGSYAIQGKSGIFIKRVIGDIYTVIGLPINKVYRYLKHEGYYEED